MPIYSYRCSSCLVEEERILPMAQRNDSQIHSCGNVMERLMSLPQPAIIPIKNRDRILHTLNRDKGFGFPGDKHTTRYGNVIMDSLTQEKPVIGRGL